MKLGRVGVSSLVKGGFHPPRKTLPSPHSVNHSPMNEDRPSFTVRLREKLALIRVFTYRALVEVARLIRHAWAWLLTICCRLYLRVTAWICW